MSSYFSSLRDRADLYVLAALGDVQALDTARRTSPYAWKRVRRVMTVASEQVDDRDLDVLLAVIDPHRS